MPQPQRLQAPRPPALRQRGRRSWAAAAAAAAANAVFAATRAAGQSQPAATAALASPDKALPFRMKVDHGGGAECTRDVECGWYDPNFVGEDRLSFPSGNGARCLVGHCVCPNSFDDKYGCSRCSVRLRTRYAYSDEAMVVTSMIRNQHGEHIDLCEYPTGGKRCEVGVCKRDNNNMTIWCPGDTECDVAGVGAGACIGPEGGIGHCLCAEGMYCSDCSLHEEAFVEGAKCDRYATGGAHCRSHSDCSKHAYCAHVGVTGEEGEAEAEARAFCKCDAGYGCRRCRHHVRELESGQEMCDCDPPSFHPNGGEFKVRSLEVKLTHAPWDSYAECELLFFVDRVLAVPLAPIFRKDAPKVEAARHMFQMGTKQSMRRDGTLVPVRLLYNSTLDKFVDEGGAKPVDMYYIWAITVPRPNTTWQTDASRVFRSEVFILSGAAPQPVWAGNQVLLLLLLLVLSSQQQLLLG